MTTVYDESFLYDDERDIVHFCVDKTYVLYKEGWREASLGPMGCVTCAMPLGDVVTECECGQLAEIDVRGGCVACGGPR